MPKYLIISPNGLLGTTLDTFCGLGSMGWSCKSSPINLLGARSNVSLKNGYVQ